MPLPVLKNPALFTQHAYLGGEWQSAGNGKTLTITNPATGEVLGTVPALGRPETAQAIAAAEVALPEWRNKTAQERATLLRRWFNLMVENADDLAAIMTAEQGKPLAEARGEILYGASFIDWFAEEGKRIYGDIIPTTLRDKRYLTIKQPIGVVAAITPWNFPNAMITRKAGPALAAGCTIVLKPASQTPFSALALAVLAEQAGIPAGVFNVVTGAAHEVAAELIDNPTIRKLTFTGSTEIGRQIMAQSAKTLKKLSLELGGNAPFIVFDDADIPAAIDGAMASKYRNAGQTCVCANRFYVQDSVYDAFVTGFTERVKSLKIGNGATQGTQIGPMIDTKAVQKTRELIQLALDNGATLRTGGHPHELGGLFLEPTILENVSFDNPVLQHEIFGPVAPITRFQHEKDVIHAANDTEYGLAAYFYGRDIGRIFRVAEALEYGIVGVNTGIISTEVAPFGGVKQSGFGREGSKYGIEDYLEIKYICLGGL